MKKELQYYFGRRKYVQNMTQQFLIDIRKHTLHINAVLNVTTRQPLRFVEKDELRRVPLPCNFQPIATQ